MNERKNRMNEYMSVRIATYSSYPLHIVMNDRMNE